MRNIFSGVASTQQMEQLRPGTAMNHFCKSCKSDEIFGGGAGEGVGVGWLSQSAC